MKNLASELKRDYESRNAVKKEDLDFVVSTIVAYAQGLSSLTKIDISYFVNIMRKVDMILFPNDQEQLKELGITLDCYRTMSFQSKNQLGIYIHDDRKKYQEDGLTREMVNICIQYTQNKAGIIKNRGLALTKDSRLHEGILESITQKTWKILKPEEECLGEKEDRYFMELQIADALIDIMGKEEFLKNIFLNPTKIINKIGEVSYQGQALTDYLDYQMRPLVPYHGNYQNRQISSVNLLDSFEAICDCGSLLKLGSEINSDENKSKAR